jgi:hypothetical protein
MFARTTSTFSCDIARPVSRYGEAQIAKKTMSVALDTLSPLRQAVGVVPAGDG